MKKKLLAIVCLTMVLTVTGCGQSSSSSALEKEFAELKAEIEELKEEHNELKAKIYDYENNKPAQTTEASELDGFVAETRGVCGADLTWEYGNGILRISGTGEMSDFNYQHSNPWEDIRYKISHVYVEEGCTYIGKSAFEKFRMLSKVVLPASVTSVGESSFRDSDNLKLIVWGDYRYEIDESHDLRLDVEDRICNDGHEAKGMWGFWTAAAEVPSN